VTHPASISDDAVAGPPLEFTGERFTPECVREIWYEHWHRYVFARAFAPGRRVLDAACGEGYGSAMLADAAASVLGVDIADAAVAHARQRYAEHANLRFEQGDCTALTCADGQFDLIVSFETLEHVAAQEALIAGFARTLAPDGLLIISSPDKRTSHSMPASASSAARPLRVAPPGTALISRHLPPREGPSQAGACKT